MCESPSLNSGGITLGTALGHLERKIFTVFCDHNRRVRPHHHDVQKSLQIQP